MNPDGGVNVECADTTGTLTKEWHLQYMLIHLVKTFFRTEAVHSADATTEMSENNCCKALSGYEDLC